MEQNISGNEPVTKPDLSTMSSAAYYFHKYGKHRILTPEQKRKRKATKAQDKARKLNRK